MSFVCEDLCVESYVPLWLLVRLRLCSCAATHCSPFFQWVILSKMTGLCLFEKRGEPPLAPPCPSWLFLCNCRRATLSWPGQSLGTFLSLLHKLVSLLVISFDSSQTGEHGLLSIGPGTWCRRTCVAISASASLSAPLTSFSYGLPLTAK